MNYDFNPLKKQVKEVEDWLKKEQSQIRTGRATPTLLDNVRVEVYGSMSPLNQVGTVTTEGPRSLRVNIWDTAQIKNVEKAITAVNLGVSVGSDEKGVRVSFPELTSERRVSVVKIAKEKLESARVSLRKLRDETWNAIQTKEKEGGMSEDEKFRFKGDMEKIIQESNKNLDTLHDAKEQEIMN